MKTQEQKLREALTALVDMYVANKGSKSEFICCITPKSTSGMSYAERRRDKIWRAWDDAREALGEFEEEK